MTELIKQDICNTQQDIFALAINMGFDDEDFTHKYMTSNFCNQNMDSAYSFFQTADEGYCMEYILDEIHPRKNTQHHNIDVIRWIGWIYRYIHIELNIASKEIYTILPFNKMLHYYPGMHTQSEDYFVDVIKEKLLHKRTIPIPEQHPGK